MQAAYPVMCFISSSARRGLVQVPLPQRQPWWKEKARKNRTVTVGEAIDGHQKDASAHLGGACVSQHAAKGRS